MISTSETRPFQFPEAQSTEGIPDPSPFFAANLLSSPLPTNSFFQNFVLKDGCYPPYIQPYLVGTFCSSLSICYPNLVANSNATYAEFVPDLIIASSFHNINSKQAHVVSSFSDLSVTLDFPCSNLTFFLVRGSPYLTCAATSGVEIWSRHDIRRVSPTDTSLKKYTINLDNKQKWLLYSSSPIHLSRTRPRSITSTGEFSGIIRIALLTDSSPLCESILDSFSSCYPVSGEAVINEPFCVEYKWEKKGEGGLLMLAHPLHDRLLSLDDSSVTVLENFKYKSLDGDLVGVVGDSWVLKTNPIPITWYSVNNGIREEAYSEIRDALRKDLDECSSARYEPKDSYAPPVERIAKVARLALIAEEVSYPSVIPEIKELLKNELKPWLDDGFLYEVKWGGIVCASFSHGSQQELYNGQHIHLGYFVYAISVLAKIDPAWGRKYKPQAYSLVADFMNLDRGGASSFYTRLRCFDLWKLHSWDSGLAGERRQDCTSEAVSAYYSAALMGLAYEDTSLVDLGSTLMALEILSAQTWCHVKKENNIYHPRFSSATRIVDGLYSAIRRNGVLMKQDKITCYSPPNHLLPLLPITEVLFSDIGYVKQLVKWITSQLQGEDEGQSVIKDSNQIVGILIMIYDKDVASDMIRSSVSEEMESRNSVTNLLWWFHSRGYGGSDLNLGNVCRVFTYEELEKATNQFSKYLGQGGFGLVYKGMLADGTNVAVKRLLNIGGKQSGFVAEVETISRTKHRYLVSLVGYCISGDERMLVYKFVPNKTLYDHLCGQDGSVMGWENRVKVGIGAARGISYLHEDCDPPIIHRDIKSSNILLEKNFTAKVADFGLAKLIPDGKKQANTLVRGTPVYIDPEYYNSRELTFKSDVYSFGVVLLELITGRDAWSMDNGESWSLVTWAQPFLKEPHNNENFHKLVDPRLGTNFDKSEMLVMIKIAAACVSRLGSERPPMHQVVSDLARMQV